MGKFITQRLYKTRYPAQKAETNNLFSGIWIRWRALTVAERFVCANIVLLPAWWVVGLFYYMPLLLLVGVAVYEWRQYGKLRFKQPSLPVIALFAFGVYQLVRLWLYFDAGPNPLDAPLEPSQASVEIVLLWFCPAFLLWYIQSNKIRVRVEVVAWACTVSVVQMIGLWLALQFVLPETLFFPPRLRNLFALLTNRSTKVSGEQNLTYYLYPYETFGNLFDLPRFSLFFNLPELFAAVVGVMSLVALDIKNRLWSWLLFFACVFLILLSGTRAAWIALPIVLGLRHLFTNIGKRWGPPVIFALIAVASFIILSLPPVSELISDAFTYSAGAVGDARAESTGLRSEIYRQTWEGIQDNPVWGHTAKGPAVNPWIPFGRVGTHSLILGQMLYCNGLVGTAIFMTFWISLFVWFYKTRAARPLSCFCLLIFYSLLFPTQELGMPLQMMILVLFPAIYFPKAKSARGMQHA